MFSVARSQVVYFSLRGYELQLPVYALTTIIIIIIIIILYLS